MTGTSRTRWTWSQATTPWWRVGGWMDGREREGARMPCFGALAAPGVLLSPACLLPAGHAVCAVIVGLESVAVDASRRRRCCPPQASPHGLRRSPRRRCRCCSRWPRCSSRRPTPGRWRRWVLWRLHSPAVDKCSGCCAANPRPGARTLSPPADRLALLLPLSRRRRAGSCSPRHRRCCSRWSRCWRWQRSFCGP